MSEGEMISSLDLIDGRGPGFPRPRAAKFFGPFFPPKTVAEMFSSVALGVRELAVALHHERIRYNVRGSWRRRCMVSEGV